MKLLAVFGLALAVVAIDGPTSDRSKLPIYEPQLPLKLLEFDPSSPEYCTKLLSMIDEGEISLAENPKVVFSLIRGCLETGISFYPKDHIGMNIVHVAAFIFMLRVQRNEDKAKSLYNAVMKEHFLAEFLKELHEKAYPEHPLMMFESLSTPNPPKGLECLQPDDRQLFFMLWTAQMYGKNQDVSQMRLLEDLNQVALIFANMGVPLEVQIVGIIALQKKLPVGITPSSLSNLQLTFFSLNRAEYLRLREVDKTLLRAFLKKYLIFRWKCLGLPAEGLSDEEFEQFQEAFKLEDEFRCEHLDSDTIIKFTEYFRNVMQINCPAFLLKKKIDFCLREPFFTMKEILDKKRCLSRVLSKTLRMIEEEKMYPSRGLIRRQIARAIKECESEISELLAKLLEGN